MHQWRTSCLGGKAGRTVGIHTTRQTSENAYIERYNRTVRYDWLSQYCFESIAQVHDYTTKWLWTYNHEQPKMAIG
ncbi:MAG: integrase core domain-containing protein [Nitrosomonas sp.]|nr:integrase core domain-containing protein [Nitrosomonas sp.]